MGILERLLGLGSLECSKVPIAYWQVAIPNFSGAIRLISLEVIALITYLGNQVLVALVIAFNFLSDFHLFLLETINANSSGPSSLSKRI